MGLATLRAVQPYCLFTMQRLFHTPSGLCPNHCRVRLTGVLVLAMALMSVSGCAIGNLIGGMAASAERAGSTVKKPKYTGLTGKNFAVIVSADRSVQADFPALVTLVTVEMTRRLSENADAAGMLPAGEVLRYQSVKPSWVARPLDQLAKDLEVERLVYVDIQSFALTEPGNPYLYSGVASGTVNVIEADSATPSVFAFTEAVRVTYPDQTGTSEQQMPRDVVFRELARRLIERSAWMFYEHEEPNIIKY